jgi:hypothetical protein
MHSSHRATLSIATTAVTIAILGVTLGGCASVRQAVPTCNSVQRLALVSQSVPSATYVPCLEPLAPGWSAGGFQATSTGTHFTLTSDRAPGRAVRVELASSCDISGTIPTTARAAGVRTLSRLQSVSPRYSGTLFDVFVGGCITYRFDLPRGPHIPLMEEFEAAVVLYPRQDVILAVRRRLGVTIDP